MKYLLLFICNFFLYSNFISAQQQDINKMLESAPPHVRDLLKNLPPGSLNQMMKDNKPKGKLTFSVIPSGSALGIQALGAPIALAPLSDAMKGGTAYAIKVDYCGKDLVTKYMYVLTLDTNSKRNLFITNQEDNTASIILTGIMQRWDFNCDTKEFQKSVSGFGGMQVNFATSVHLRPRLFQVLAGSKDMRGEYLKKVKEAQLSMLQNMSKYYADIGEYLKKPGISIINIPDYGPVGGVPPAPTGMKSDEKDAVTTGSAIGTTINAITSMAGIKNTEDIKNALFDFAKGKAVEFLDKQIESLGIAEVTASYNLFKEVASAATDPGGYMMDKAIQGMIQQIAAVNKQYAENGNPNAQKVQEAAKKEMRHKDKPYSYTDADYMASLLNKAYDSEIKRLEAEAKLESQLPPTSASGKIWGPGLWEDLQVFASTPGEPVAFSDAPGENKSSVDPNVLAALRKAGYPVPDVIPEAKFKDANFEFDATKPYFHGKLSGTEMMSLPMGMSYPKLMVMFSISSPEEPYDFEWKGLTIFDPPFINTDEEEEKKKCTYYVSITGSNNNPGTLASPFATLQYALNKAKICRTEKKSVDIIIQDGIYHQSATVTWNDLPDAPALKIMSANPGGAIFISTENSSSSWQSSASGWQSNLPLHPQQPAWASGGNISTNPPPAVVVNGKRLTYFPMTTNIPAPAMYNITGTRINIRPPGNVTNLNSATVEVGVRPFALKMSGVKNVTISNIVFKYYSQTSGNASPGIIKLGGSQITVTDCVFE